MGSSSDHLTELRSDLRNRAAAVSGFAALLAEEIGESDVEAVRDHLGRLLANAREMDALLNAWDQLCSAPPLPGRGAEGKRKAGPSNGPADRAIPTLLLVEDEDDHFLLLRSLLIRDRTLPDWMIIRATSLQEARLVVRREDFACILLDLGLPDSVGLQTLSILRGDAPNRPIVVLTAYSDSAAGVEAVRCGAQDFVVKGTVTRDLLNRTVTYAIERARAEAQLAHQALHDGLTGLANRTLFLDRLAHACARLNRAGTMAAVLFVDLDGFKLVNDSLGHGAGDELLIAVAERLRSDLRAVDTVARFGGDEFVVLAEGLCTIEDVRSLARNILKVFAEPFPFRQGTHSLTASVGVAVTSNGDMTPDVLVANADTAMYRAKDLGRSRFVIFDEPMRTRVVARFETERELERALCDGELDVAYQPIVKLDDGRIFGVEALLRWRHPLRGLLTAGEFLAVAEQSGQIVEIGAWVWQKACRECAAWARAGRLPDDFVLWVNASARQMESPRLESHLSAALAFRHGGWRLGIEITESALIRDLDRTSRLLGRLRGNGLRVAVDDFGTGFSSLHWLRSLPIDHLKIDKSFTDGLGSDTADEAIVEACIGLASGLGISCVAEGVENVGHLHRLRKLGCAAGQGFFFSVPMPATEIAPILAVGYLDVGPPGEPGRGGDPLPELAADSGGRRWVPR